MKIEANGLNLYDTLFSGQCFRMSIDEDGSYTIILSDRVINIREENGYLIIQSNNNDNLEDVVRDYLDLNRDYELINKVLASKCDILKNNIHLCEGYKILNQDKFEMFITYIISQNNNVKRIMGIVEKISKKYGKKIVFRGNDFYLFPTFEELRNVSVEELRDLGLGFRDRYVRNALDKLEKNPLFLEDIDKLSTEDALKELTSIKGIGTKVASCILLFAFKRLDTYPIDTWVRHFVSENFDIKDNIKDISEYMKDVFGEYSGLAIQYFFHISRNMSE